MKIVSWNVNGLRSAIKNNPSSWLFEDNWDAICLQEVKMHEDLFSKDFFAPKVTFWNTALKSGYSGVATALNPRLHPISVSKGIGDSKLDDEGRVLSMEFESFILINTYAPHSHRKLLRLKEKELFCAKFLNYIQDLRKHNKPIIIVGDLNVAHQEIDLYNFKSNKKNAGFLPQERQWIDNLLSMGFVDSFRFLFPDKKQYSWWGFMHNLRERDIGWRIDYILVDASLKHKIKSCSYLKDKMGSDHCPIIVDIDI